MRVVLVAPQSCRPFLATRLSTELSPPMGVLYLASAVRAEADVSVLDVQAHRLSAEATAETVLARAPDVVGISISFATILPTALRLAAALRARADDLFICAGGNSATFEADELMATGLFDAIALREGERTFVEVIRRLSARRPLTGIAGLVWRSDEGVTTRIAGGYVANLDELRFPDFGDLDEPARYLKSIVSSRGCRYGCIYCSTQQMWRRWRARSAESILAELDVLLTGFRTSRLAFVDDEFTLDRERVVALCAGLRARGNPVEWSFAARLERVDAELLDLVAAAGCGSIFFGVESGSDRVLACLRRRYTVGDVHQTVAACRARGISPVLSLMIGNPYETAADVEATLRLLGAVDTPRLNLSIFTPFRGTPVRLRPERYGVKLLTEPDLWRPVNDDTGDVQHRTRHLSEREIRDYWYEGVGIILSRRPRAPAGQRVPEEVS